MTDNREPNARSYRAIAAFQQADGDAVEFRFQTTSGGKSQG